MYQHYKICSRCVMDTSDPDITFDENGVCNHCIRAQNLINEKVLSGVKGIKKCEELVNTIKQDGKIKNMIVSSGSAVE